jgi:hypothetical protein
LRLPHAGRGISRGVLDQQLDLPAENAALRVDHLRVELGAALLLLADRAKGAGQSERHADLDDVGCLGLRARPDIGRSDGRAGSSRDAANHLAPV